MYTVSNFLLSPSPHALLSRYPNDVLDYGSGCDCDVCGDDGGRGRVVAGEEGIAGDINQQLHTAAIHHIENQHTAIAPAPTSSPPCASYVCSQGRSRQWLQ